MATKARNARKDRTVRVVVTVTVAVVVLFAAVSIACYLAGLRTPEKNYCGWIGHQLATGLFFAFGWMSALVPVLGGAAAAFTLLKKAPWRRYVAASVCALGLMLLVGLASYHTGGAAARTNLAGWLGWVSAAFLSFLLGLGSYSVPVAVLLVGASLWPQRWMRQVFYRVLTVVSVGLFLDVFVAYFLPRAVWPVPGGAGFSYAGVFGLAVNRGLQSLIGPVGTLILLIAVVVVALGVFTTIQLPSGTRLFDRLRAWLAARLRRRPEPVRPQPTPVPVSDRSDSSDESDKPDDPVPAEEPKAGAEEEGAEAEKMKRSRPARPRVMADFDLSRFQTSFLEQLDKPGPEDQVFKDPREASREAEQLLDKLRQFGVEGRVSNIVSGPMITRFEFEPAPGIKIQRIENLADDLSLALSAERIRILAPIPGRNAVGIEIPNKERRTVHLRDVLTSNAFRNEAQPLGFALGTTITGEPYCADLRKMPHILIAGTTGSGKSVCINTIITSLIYRASPREVRFLTIDPKQLELPVYNPIPHLLSRATIDPKKAVTELDEVVKIMEVRYGEFAELGVRDIVGYNERAAAAGLERKPYIVIIIDELADLMLRAPDEIEERITRLAQMSRAVGIHLILATQRPSVDVITGLIKANFPCRITFQVASKTDSRTILDMNGAEALLGRGDMLFLPPGKGDPIRLHGAFVSDRAARNIVNLWTVVYLAEQLKGLVPDPAEKARAMVEAEVVDVLYDPEKRGIRRKRQTLCSILPEEVVDELMSRDYYEPLPEVRSGAVEQHEEQIRRDSREIDEHFADAARLVVRHREASVSMLQRRLDVGWARAGRIIDQLQEAGIVGPHAGSKSRKVLVENPADLDKILAAVKSGAVPPAESVAQGSEEQEEEEEDDA